MRRLFAAVGTCGLAIGVALGGPPAPAAPTSVSELVARLGADDFRTREAAGAALEKSGAAAIPALRAAAESANPEVRQRAAAILFKLQRTAESVALLAPKKVSLAYRDTPLGTAINDLKARTGLNLTLDPAGVADPLRTVTCATGELPVWEAVERFCIATGLREVHPLELAVPNKPKPASRRVYVPAPTVPAPDAVPVVLVDGKGERLPGARDTAVRVLALPRTFPGHRVALGTGETTLCFDIAPTPGLNWQAVVGVKITKLIDDAGRPGSSGSLPPTAPAGSEGVVANWGGQFDGNTGRPIPPDGLPNRRIVAVPLKLGTPSARSIARLEGHILGEVLVANQTLVTVTDPAKSSGTTFDAPGEMRVTVVAVTEPKGKAGASVEVRLAYPSPWAANARRGFNPGGIWPEAPRAEQTPTIKAFDAKGKEMPGVSRGGYSDSSDDGLTLIQHITLSFRPDAGTPAKLVLVGARPVIVEVPFVLENVPLP